MSEDKAALTERELEIVRAVATGATNQQIALELTISVNTVKVHLKNIFSKLDIQSRTEVAVYAVRERLVEVESAAPAVPETVSTVSEPGREPISRRKRLILVAAMVIALAVVLLPPVETSPAVPSTSEFADEGTVGASSATSVQASRWNEVAPLPEPRSRVAAVYAEGKIYVIGGDTPDGPTGRVDEYEIAANSWRTRSPKPIPAHNIGAAFVGGKVFVPGGWSTDDEVLDELEVYDPATDTWSLGASMPRPLCAYAIASVGNEIYLFGGWDGNSYVASSLMYDPENDTWKEISPMPSARGFSAAGVVDGRVYVVGGYDGEREMATVEEYDPALEGQGSPWQQRRLMNTARGGLGVASIVGSLYAIGGGWNGYMAFNERYDARSDEWSMVGTPVFGQWRNLAVVASETRIYALGGWNGSFMDANHEYQALFTYYLPEVR
jgi:DNA-binding CsgD family transcriptional regulator/N-acetylneuraminic acid mutarotase